MVGFMKTTEKAFSLFRDVAKAQGVTGQPEATFRVLADALRALVGHKVMTVLKFDVAAMQSVRLYSSEPSYPLGGIKQHHPGAWSEAIVVRGRYFIAATTEEVRAAFPDHAGITAAGCGAVLCLPVLFDGRCLATLNLWHISGHYDVASAELAQPFSSFLIHACLN